MTRKAWKADHGHHGTPVKPKVWILIVFFWRMKSTERPMSTGSQARRAGRVTTVPHHAPAMRSGVEEAARRGHHPHVLRRVEVGRLQTVRHPRKSLAGQS
jgi:hypothetical protein